jgi:ribonuclease HIII
MAVSVLSQVFKVRPREIYRLKNLLLNKKGAEPLELKNPSEVFRVRYNDFLLIGYKTGKIVGNKEQAKNLMLEFLPKILEDKSQKITIGSDEAGKGEWLGPIVVAAVALTREESIRLQSYGIMDSKELSLKKIKSLADLINDNYLYERVIITAKRFNELFKELKDEQKTLNDLLAWGHAVVIDRLFDSLQKDYRDVKIVIDEFDRVKTYRRLCRVINVNKLEVIQQPRAEEYTAVAAASIIARNTREEYLDYLSHKFGVDFRLITPEDAISDERINEYAKVAFLQKLLSTKYKIAFK